jgi:isoleucyl-tRNA synthetase
MMKFKSGTRRRAIEYEKDLVKYWKANHTFEKSIEQRPTDNAYVFYDGPPFITGVPHHGTLLSSIVKDAVPRYQTMKGKRVERVWGWDCHGLPAEVYTEKKLGLKGKQEILDYGLEKYIVAARENMVATSSLWEDTIDRIGRWVDFKGAYKTMDNNYIESVWWAFKELYDKGKIYEGEKVLMYCTQDATPLSKAEVTMDSGAYQDVTDPSVYVKFKLENGMTLLAWTTTPWTLPANTALAVNEAIDYVEIKLDDGTQFVLAKTLAAKVLTDEKHTALHYEIVRELKGAELVGQRYEPLFVDRGEGAHKVWHADYVSVEDGTGIVHLAPAYGEEDFTLAKEKGIPVVHTIDETGYFTEGDWKGEYVWDINKTIAKELYERDVVWKIDYIRHSYPHCHRCGTKLMYRAHPSWFMDIAGQREAMLEENSENINWFPPHVKHGRFEKTVEQAPDWNLSRDRFWASPMPIWEGEKDGQRVRKVVGSFDELEQLSGKRLDDYHRPWIDDVTFEVDGVIYRRIDKVMDSWFEAGSMPFAQFHYPFENVEKFEASFPGDFIVEYIGQVRAWFYYVHAVSVGLFGKNAFKNVIVTGNVAGNDGRKMSKSYGNYTDPNELMDKFSADALRFLLLQSPLLNGEDYALQDKEVGDIARKLSMVWNMYDFFTMYAEVDGWEWNGTDDDPLAEPHVNPLDQWIISRVHQLTAEIDEHMSRYDIPSAVKPILPFIEDASNWYVRRSRRRFWKSGDDSDKQAAYQTLHYVLTRLAVVMAPFTPFLADELYQKMTGNGSVHLLDWPSNGHVNELVVKDMEEVREFVNIGLSLRAAAKLKVRQPLMSVTVPRLGDFVNYEEILKDELNVKEVKVGPELALDTELTSELKQEGLMREIVRQVQSTRKEAGLNVDDRISLLLIADDTSLKSAIATHGDTIKAETLAKQLATSGEQSDSFSKQVAIEGASLTISLSLAV